MKYEIDIYDLKKLMGNEALNEVSEVVAVQGACGYFKQGLHDRLVEACKPIDISHLISKKGESK